MTTKLDPFDGTIEVRVVLYVRVDPKAWAENMMGLHPDEVLHRDVRGSVKGYARHLLASSPQLQSTFSQIDPVPITSVTTPEGG